MRKYVTLWRGANIRIGIVADERAARTGLLDAMKNDGMPPRLQSPLIAAVRDGDRHFVEKAAATMRKCRWHQTADYLRHWLTLGKENGDRSDLPKDG